jgi:prevent-host-death family protein
MKTWTSVVSLSEFKAKAAQMLAEMKASEHEIVLTQNGAATAVVQDYESYQRLQEALAMMKLMAQGEAHVKEGRTTAQDRMFSDLRKRLTRGDV